MNLHLFELTCEKKPPCVLEQIERPNSSNKRFPVDHA
jgi:hypothetical protein